jgi:hypothetical protein
MAPSVSLSSGASPTVAGSPTPMTCTVTSRWAASSAALNGGTDDPVSLPSVSRIVVFWSASDASKLFTAKPRASPSMVRGPAMPTSTSFSKLGEDLVIEGEGTLQEGCVAEDHQSQPVGGSFLGQSQFQHNLHGLEPSDGGSVSAGEVRLRSSTRRGRPSSIRSRADSICSMGSPTHCGRTSAPTINSQSTASNVAFASRCAVRQPVLSIRFQPELCGHLIQERRPHRRSGVRDGCARSAVPATSAGAARARDARPSAWRNRRGLHI